MDLNDPYLEISALRKELEEKERNLIYAAQIGKELLEQNAVLNKKWEESVKDSGQIIEELKQEKYLLNLKLEGEEAAKKNSQAELEHQETLHQKELEKQKNSLQKLNNLVSSHERTIENLQDELQFNARQVEELQNVLQETSKKCEKESEPLQNISQDESAFDLQEEKLMSLNNEKQALEKEVNTLAITLKSCQYQLEKSKATQQALSSELESRECELTTLFNKLEKSKDEIQELKVEIDNMKLQETDPNRKGNSIFAEVEDNRKFLEQKLLSHKEKLTVIKKQYDIKSQQIIQMKTQISSLLLMDKSESEQSYRNHLEESLYEAKKQLEDYSILCQNLRKKLEEQSKEFEITNKKEVCTNEEDSQEFFKYLYHQAKTKIAELESEMEFMRFKKISQSDQLHEMKRKAFIMEKERDALNGKLVQVNIKLEELQGTHNVDKVEDKKPTVKDVEILPFYDKINASKKNKEVPEVKAPPSPKAMASQLTDFKSIYKSQGFDKFVEDKENRDLFTCSEITEKKPKKAVQLQETIQILEDSKITEHTLKEHDGGVKLKKVAKPLRKVQAPHIDATDYDPSEQCRQQ